MPPHLLAAAVPVTGAYLCVCMYATVCVCVCVCSWACVHVCTSVICVPVCVPAKTGGQCINIGADTCEGTCEAAR